MSWFQDGDRNTNNFYTQVNGRRKILQLRGIKDTNGNWIEENEAIANEAVHFFQKQFHEANIPTAFGIIEHVP